MKNKNYYKNTKQETNYDDIVIGRNAVTELLRTDRDINKLFVQRGEKHRLNK